MITLNELFKRARREPKPAIGHERRRVGVVLKHTGGIEYESHVRQAHFDDYNRWLFRDLIEAETRDRLLAGGPTSWRAPDTRSKTQDAPDAPQSEENMRTVLDASVRPDDGWFERHAERLMASLKGRSNEELRELVEGVRQDEEAGKLVIGVPRRK